MLPFRTFQTIFITAQMFYTNNSNFHPGKNFGSSFFFPSLFKIKNKQTNKNTGKV